LKKSGPSSKQTNNDLAQALGRAISAFQTNNFEEAYRLCELILKQDKGNVVALHLFGILNARRSDFPNALKSLDRALTLSPHNPDLYVDKGKILNETGRPEDALLCLDKALAINGRHPIALDLKASILLLLKRPADTLDIFDRLLQIAPNHSRTLNNRGLALTELGRHDDAIASFRLAAASDQKNPEIWANLGIVYVKLGKPEDAVRAYSEAMRLDPQLPFLKGHLLHQKMLCCDWSNIESMIAGIESDIELKRPSADPGGLLSISSSPEEQLECAKFWVSKNCPASSKPIWRGEVYKHDKIRVAYVSADFRQHPMAVLIAGLIEGHSRETFEVTGISLRPEETSEMGQRMKQAFDRFIDASGMTDQDIA
jgi:protein O-GlcNAc transferase